MPRRALTLLLAALIAATLAGLLLWHGDVDPVPGPAPTEAPPAEPSRPIAAIDAAPPDASARATTSDPAWISRWLGTAGSAAANRRGAGALPTTVRGRLVVRQRPWEPLADLEIRITHGWLDSVQPMPTEATPGTIASDDARARTDADGRFALRVRPGRGEWFFLIGQGTAWQDFQKVPELPRTGTDADLGDVCVDARGGIHGRVVDSTGAPVANATVRAIDDPLLGPATALEPLQAARIAELELFRAPGAMRAGPVPDWVVRRDRLLPFPRTQTDADGRFLLLGVRPGSHDVIVQDRASQSRGSSRGILVAAERTTRIGDVRLRAGTAVAIRCIDELAQPWRGAVVALLDRTTGFGGEPHVTDREGRAQLEAPTRDAVLLFQHPDGGPWLPIDDGRQPEGDVVVPRPARVTIRLTDAGGRGLPGGTVRSLFRAESFRAIDQPMPASMQPREHSPGLHHAIAITTVRIVAAVPGFAPAIALAEPGTHVDLTLVPLQSMTVQTVDLQGRPVADAAVYVKVEDNPQHTFPGARWGALADNAAFVGTTDARGELTIPAWPAEFSFQATHPDFVPSPGPRVVPHEGLRQRLLLRRGADLIGRLTLQQRPAPKGLRVRARQRPPLGSELATSAWLQQELAVTGPGGEFAFRGLCAGDWVLEPEWPMQPAQDRARHPPSRFRTLELTLHDGQQRHCLLEAQADPLEPTDLVGRVQQNGAFLERAIVRVRELGKARNANPTAELPAPRTPRGSRHAGPRQAVAGEPPWLRRCDVDAYGEYRIGGLDAGREYEVRLDLERDGRLQFLARKVVRAGDDGGPTRVDFIDSGGSVQLRCTDLDGPFANRMLRLRQVAGSQERARFEILLDDDGAAFVEAMPAGEWTLEPVHGGRCEPAQLSLHAAEAAAWFLQITTADR